MAPSILGGTWVMGEAGIGTVPIIGGGCVIIGSESIGVPTWPGGGMPGEEGVTGVPTLMTF